MKIYEVTNDESRQWFDKKAEAQAASKKAESPMVTYEVGSPRAGYVEFLNEVANTPPTVSRTVVRVTANKPPVSDHTNESGALMNYMFDCAASIESKKSFGDITVPEFCAAMRLRLDRVEQSDEIDSFGFCDEYEV